MQKADYNVGASHDDPRTEPMCSLPCSRLLALAAVCAAIPVGSSSALAQLSESSTGVPSTIQVRITLPASPQVLPDTLFGSFLEPIGHSTYGGLWADVVENPSFESGLWSVRDVARMVEAEPALERASQLGLPLPWRPLFPDQGNRYAPIRGDAANSDQSLLLMGLPEKEVGVAQTVYLPVQRELHYSGALWVQHKEGEGTLTLSLRRHDQPDQTLATTIIDANAATWNRYSFHLALTAGQVERLEPVDLVIAVHGNLRVQMDNVSLNPDDAVDGMDPDEIRMARAMHTPVVRFGGNFTSAYNWRDGIGPEAKRVSMRNVSWGIPEYNTFGTDEFLDFCKQIGAEPQIALNLGTGTPEEAAAWVRYVDKHWNNGKGGLLWELGNELWGDWQVGYPSLSDIAARTLANSKAVVGADPHARLIATGADEDHFEAWNAQQLTNPAASFNYLSTHFVVTDDVVLPNPSEQFRSMAALALPWGLGPRMHAIAEQAAAAGHPDVKVAFTEWLMVAHNNSGPDFKNMGGALFAGGFLNMLMRNADVVRVSDMTGIMEFGGIWKKRGQVYGAPAYWVFSSYAATRPRFFLPVTDNSPTYSVQNGVRRLPNIASVPYLDVVAAEDESRTHLILFCVNRSLTRTLQASFDTQALGHVGTQATVNTVTADDIFAQNDEQEPDRITAVEHTLRVRGNLAYSFPNASVTVIEVPLQR